MAEDIGQSFDPSELISPVFSIQELLTSATDLSSVSTTYPHPQMEPVDLQIPSWLLLRLQKSQYMISETMKEQVKVRKQLYELNEKLHRINIVIQNTLHKMF